MSIGTPDAEPVRGQRFLKFVALMQIPLIVAAITIYTYVFMTIRPMLQHRDALNQEIAALEKSIKVLREEGERYRVSLRQGLPASEAPITALIKPRAERRPTGEKFSTGRSIYQFSLWIEGPNDILARIAAVQYEFNHPTFREEPVMRSTKRGEGFRVSYTGWGCLTSVIITLTLAQPTDVAPRVDFDMCAAISG
jgi:hypothetical protein